MLVAHSEHVHCIPALEYSFPSFVFSTDVCFFSFLLISWSEKPEEKYYISSRSRSVDFTESLYKEVSRQTPAKPSSRAADNSHLAFDFSVRTKVSFVGGNESSSDAIYCFTPFCCLIRNITPFLCNTTRFSLFLFLKISH